MTDITNELSKLEICGKCEQSCEKDTTPTCQQLEIPIIVIVNTKSCPLEKWL